MFWSEVPQKGELLDEKGEELTIEKVLKKYDVDPKILEELDEAA